MDWSNGVKMSIMMKDLGDCQLVGSLPWDEEGLVMASGCIEDDITVIIQSQIYGNWTVEAKTI